QPSTVNRQLLGASREAPSLLNHFIRRVDLARSLFGHLAHALGQALAGELVRMILTDQPTIRLFDLRVRGGRREPQCGIGILERGRRRRAAGRGAAASGAKQRLQLRDIGGAQTEQTSDAHEHLMLGRMHVAVACDRGYLDLQEHDHQPSLAMTDARERSDLRVEIEVGRLAAIERGLSSLALLARELQTRKHRLRGRDLIARHDTVRLAERAHDGERGFQKLALYGREPLNERVSLHVGQGDADDGADQYAACAADEKTDDRKQKNEGHSRVPGNGTRKGTGKRGSGKVEMRDRASLATGYSQ